MDQLAKSCSRTNEKQKLNKISAAQQQLEGSIAEMFLGNWACSITLAGAAEGMLPEPLEKKDVFAVSRDHAVSELKLSQKDAVTQLNDKRDWLKHTQSNAPRPSLEIDQLDALIMIFRAYSRFVIATEAKSNMITIFENWAQQHYPEWVQGNRKVMQDSP